MGKAEADTKVKEKEHKQTLVHRNEEMKELRKGIVLQIVEKLPKVAPEEA